MSEIESEVDSLIARLQSEYASKMRVEKRVLRPPGDATMWSIDPHNARASPLWIIAADWSDATVGFGRSSGRIELWQRGKTAADEAARNLEDICRSVMDGRLVEWRQDANRCRYELVLGDGTTYRGSANVLFRRHWKIVERFEPY